MKNTTPPPPAYPAGAGGDRRPFLTGSRAYGTPRATSDIDLVVFLPAGEAEKLRPLADAELSADVHYEAQDAVSLRFGVLNLLVCTDPAAFDLWRRGTEELRGRAPVSRQDAVEHMAALRKGHAP